MGESVGHGDIRQYKKKYDNKAVMVCHHGRPGTENMNE